ncbi:uncharacterized protein At4g14100 [Cajanus cajan]|uniref:uncharacterized protein At4g14100 n=1 Tax=Cajanus cajan TaxID=3821 RepID=UPI00098DC048|nr:uncharacterized protein At4g14100 [Cajanus cajan]
MKLNLKLVLVWLFILLGHGVSSAIDSTPPPPTPAPWPEQFHAVLYMNLSTGHLQLSDLWYDWPKGRNVNIFLKQLTGNLLYDIEWNNGTSFYFTHAHCQITDFQVGIPRPDFLDGAVYLGTRVVDGGFLCNLWEKEAFIWYYEDVVTKIPVRWDFYDGIRTHVMSFEVGEVLPDSVTQAPAYCFTDGESLDREKFTMLENPLPHKMLPTKEAW